MNAASLRLFVVAGEESGDRLAADLVSVLKNRFEQVDIAGIGGDGLKAAGQQSLFEMDEISLMGLSAVIARLPALLRRITQTSSAAVAFRPDAVILVDAPDFNLRVAKRIRAQDPTIPIIKWVSPSVWAWRPGRAKAMTPYIDHLLALLPFEPEVHARLGGPKCTYTGHPLLSKLDKLRPAPGERTEIAAADPPSLVVMPGSRRSEIRGHAPLFGEALSVAQSRGARFSVVVPTLERIADEVRDLTADWPVDANIVVGEEARQAALRSAHAALVASGTATLEVALSGVPMIVGYRVEPMMVPVTRIIRTWTVVLPNLILGKPAIREFLGMMMRPEVTGASLAMLLSDTPERRALVESLAELEARMATGERAPAEIAADAVMQTIAERRGLLPGSLST